MASALVLESRAVNQPSAVDLRVAIGSLQLANPIIAASGTFGYGVEFASVLNLEALGAIVVKGLSLEPMAGAPSPRMCEVTSGMINAIGLQNIGVRAFASEKLPALRRYRVPVIANVFGQTQSEYLEVLRILEGAEGVAAYELNVSCPNVEHGGIEFGSDEASLAGLVRSARQIAKRPLWVKLSPLVTEIGCLAKAAEESGADAFTVANTYPAMAVDVATRQSRIGRISGGLSGPAIKPITLRLVHQVKQAVSVPVIGVGGIQSASDVLEYMVAGASAVQVGTANFSAPRACETLVSDLNKACASLNILTINKITSTLGGDLA
jgi:dihydroorotate dehydrogenase (NAD+) catalytic subunit